MIVILKSVSGFCGFVYRNNFLAESSEEESDDGRKRRAQWKKFGAPVRATSRKKEQIR